ncbi:MAG: hypothetical protein AAB592_05915 [Patescibacteria group bacterium]
MGRSILKNNKAAILIEILIAIGILIIMSSMVANTSATMISSSSESEKRLQAGALAQEGIEAVRTIRDYQWDAVTAGNHGLHNENRYWEFSGTSETIGIFTREITITNVDLDTKDITVAVRWDQKSLSLSLRLTNWK